MKRVMLITPPYHCGVVESAGRWPNLGFIYIAGELRLAGFEPIIYDAMSLFHDYERIEAELEKERPDVVGLTAITATINDSVKVMALAKRLNPDVVTMVGGVHPSFCYEELLKEHGDVVDFCVIGEGERTAPELMAALDTGGDVSKVAGIAYRDGDEIVCTEKREFLEDLDALHPAWDMIDWNDYPLYFMDNAHVAILSTSRGCIYGCSFCSQHKFWEGTYRERKPEAFTDELEHIYREYGVNVFFIGDEFPTRDRDRWVRILDLLIEKNLPVHLLMETHVDDIIRDEDILWKYVKAGILFIYTGVEAAQPGRLQTFKKNISFERSRMAIKLIKDHGMISETSLILGMPDDTVESIRGTLELAKIYNPDYMHFLMIAPWPYADLYEQLKPYVEEYDYSKYNLVAPVIKPTNMTRDEVFDEVLRCYREYYMSKIPEWMTMRGNELKRRCVLKGMKAILQNSFLNDHMGAMGKMSAHIMRYLDPDRPPAESTVDDMREQMKRMSS